MREGVEMSFTAPLATIRLTRLDSGFLTRAKPQDNGPAVRRAPEHVGVLQPSQYINLDKARALIVDDNNQSLDIIAGVLTSFGLRNIIRMNDGKAAQEELKERAFDLILTNGNLPELDGYDLIRWLRREADQVN